MPVNLSFGNQITTTGDSPAENQAYFDNLRLYNPAVYAQVKHLDPKAGQADAPAAAPDFSAQIAAAQASNPAPPPYSGPTAEAKLQALLPSGFENSLIPSSVDDPYIESSISQGRGGAQSFIENMLKRGTLTDTGRDKGLAALTAQDAGVRSKLSGISEALLAGGRSNVRGVANRGFSAASGQSGETFDPNPYYNEANAEASRFLSSFPQSYGSAVGDVGALYDTSGLASAGGGVTSPSNVSFDPYAQEGGKLTTGLEEEGKTASKKRSTAVF